MLTGHAPDPVGRSGERGGHVNDTSLTLIGRTGHYVAAQVSAARFTSTGSVPTSATKGEGMKVSRATSWRHVMMQRH